MRNLIRITVLLQAFTFVALSQEGTFQGEWRLNTERSEFSGPNTLNKAYLKVEQSGTSMTVSSSDRAGDAATQITYPLTDRAERSQRGETHFTIRTKWEGDSLLANILVSGTDSFAVDERWTRSREGSTLIVTRTVNRAGRETESRLVYENPNASVTAPITQNGPGPLSLRQPALIATTPEPKQTSTAAAAAEYVMNPGSRILMRLTNAIDTKHSAVGDRAYFETAVPVFVNRRLVIPARSYVTGTVIESERAGRVKGKSALNIRFDSITLPNGTTRDLASRAGSVEGEGDLDRKEGRITGRGNKSGDAQTVGKTTAAGTGIGAIAGAATGHLGMGAGIGAAAGALGGLAGVMGSRGPDVVLRPGTTMEFILDRELRFTEGELVERVH